MLNPTKYHRQDGSSKSPFFTFIFTESSSSLSQVGPGKVSKAGRLLFDSLSFTESILLLLLLHILISRISADHVYFCQGMNGSVPPCSSECIFLSSFFFCFFYINLSFIFSSWSH